MKILLGLFFILFIHEVAHVLTAKILKVPVQKMYIFFNTKYSLFKFNFKGTEYGLGWLPIGGYTQFNEKETPITKRLLIYSAGCIVNLAFGFSVLGLHAFEIIGEYFICMVKGDLLALSYLSFWQVVAFFSILNGIINLLPIGVLDGKRILETYKQFRNLSIIYKQLKKNRNVKAVTNK